MHARDIIRHSLDMGEFILGTYLADLGDKDLREPVAGLNPLAWQIGHLVSVERRFVEGIQPGSCPALPEGFQEAHDREALTSGDPTKGFRSRDEYLSLFRAQREATKKVLDGLPDARLDQPSPEGFQRIAPTIGQGFNLLGTHVIMHSGQFIPTRRKAGKPVVI